MLQNLLIGKKVKYSVTKESHAVGTVLAVESIQTNLNSDAVTTGYAIQDEGTNNIKHIAYWRITEILNDNYSNTIYQNQKQRDNKHQSTLEQPDYIDDLPF